jgi:hypothetical protein
LDSPGLRVEVCRRLVGEHDRRFLDERPGAIDTRCCCPPESSCRATAFHPRETDFGKDFLDALADFFLAQTLLELERERHVFSGGEHRDQVIALEDEPDHFLPHAISLLPVEPGESFPVERDFAAVDRVGDSR